MGNSSKLNNSLVLGPQRLTSPTVKVRRIGYFVAIPSVVQDREMPVMMLKRSILEWARENHTLFKHYSFNLPVTRRKRMPAGEITTVHAAGRYIKTAEELGLIVRMKGYKISKIGKAISALPTNRNPFELSIGHLFLFLKLLLERDYDCLNTLLRIRVLSPYEREDETRFFRKAIQKKLRKKVREATKLNQFYLVDRLKRRIELIANWRKPHRYYHENIKAPRLEWMLDLRFLKYWNQRVDNFEIRGGVEEFFMEEIISHRWLQDKFPYTFAGFYSDLFKQRMRYWSRLLQNERLQLLRSLMSESMKAFETGSDLGRISANEFFEYSLAFLIQEKSIVSSLSEFEQDLLNFIDSGSLNYRYVRTVSTADKGYITKL